MWGCSWELVYECCSENAVLAMGVPRANNPCPVYHTHYISTPQGREWLEPLAGLAAQIYHFGLCYRIENLNSQRSVTEYSGKCPGELVECVCNAQAIAVARVSSTR